MEEVPQWHQPSVELVKFWDFRAFFASKIQTSLCVCYQALNFSIHIWWTLNVNESDGTFRVPNNILVWKEMKKVWRVFLRPGTRGSLHDVTLIRCLLYAEPCCIVLHPTRRFWVIWVFSFLSKFPCCDFLSLHPILRRMPAVTAWSDDWQMLFVCNGG